MRSDSSHECYGGWRDTRKRMPPTIHGLHALSQSGHAECEYLATGFRLLKLDQWLTSEERCAEFLAAIADRDGRDPHTGHPARTLSRELKRLIASI